MTCLFWHCRKIHDTIATSRKSTSACTCALCATSARRGSIQK